MTSERKNNIYTMELQRYHISLTLFEGTSVPCSPKT